MGHLTSHEPVLSTLSHGAAVTLPCAASTLSGPALRALREQPGATMPVRVIATGSKGFYLAASGLGAGSAEAVLPVLTADAWALPTALRLGLTSRECRLDSRVGDVGTLSARTLDLPSIRLRIVRSWTPARVAAPSPTRSLDRPLRLAPVSLPSGRHQLTAALAPAVRAALTGADPAPALAAVIGLGPGLTPSGDDAVAGALLTLHGLGLGSGLATAVIALADRTTALSASLLAAAADGFAVPEVVAFVTAVLGGDEERVAGTRHTVESIGHWSGRDLIAGVATALACVSELDLRTPLSSAHPPTLRSAS